MVVKNLKDHEGRIDVSVGSLIMVGFSAHPHLNAGANTGLGVNRDQTSCHFRTLSGECSPVCEGIVDYCF